MDNHDYLNSKGRIFDIQRFSVHDGPGIRTIFFLKGCFLRCRWCCNPESQSGDIEQMTIAGKTKTVGRDVTVAELVEIAERDRIYYSRSGGGVTLSGGECLYQSEFAANLLRACKEKGINTAIESTGFSDFSKIEPLLANLDLFLMDIKHTNSAKHKEFTGVPNELIKQNAHLIAKACKELIIRVPVIPTFNDTPEEIADIASFAATLSGVKEIHLLPYHRLGYDKYIGLGREYSIGDVELLSQDKIAILKAAAERSGLIVKIGG